MASLSNSQTLTEGQNLTLTVSVNGTAPFTYQWRKGGTAITGATASSLPFTPVRATDAGTYTVVITNSVSSVTSGPVVLAVNPAVAPTLGYQPGNLSYTVGDTLNLSASVSGTDPMTFTWKRGTTTLQTGSSSYYSKANLDASDAGSYTVTASNIAGSVTSNPSVVTVNPVTAPSIGYVSSDTTVPTGGTLSLSASISGTGTVTAQWRKDGVAIAGATNSYFYKSGVTAADAGNYTVVASNSAGSVTSSVVRVTVSAPVAPTISSISAPLVIGVGEWFSLSVLADGTGPLSYQWRKDGVAIAGATSSYFSKSNAQAADAGAYSAIVSNAQGSVTSSNTTVSIAPAQPPIITYHPASFAVRLGEYMSSISVGASGSGQLSYQWRKNGTPIANATSSSLYFSNSATAADAGTYTVVVSSAQGSATSEPCIVAILPALAPAIVTQPASQTLRQGETLSCFATVSASSGTTYQWRKDGVAIAGATASSYTKPNVASSDAGVYSLVATNSAGSATSSGATLTVLPAAAPKITAHPASASLLPGDYFYGLYVNVTSSSTFTVQWYRDGVAVTGATGSSYYLYNAQPAMAGTYTAVVTNASSSVTSREAVITVDPNTTRPAITYVAGSRAVSGGSGVTLDISTSSSGEAVQWFKDGIIIANATAKTYSFNSFAPGSVGTYTAQVTNASGTFTSRPIVLELLDAGVAPLITTQPRSRTVSVGSYGYGANFSVAVEGEAPLTFQWRKDGTAISGATSSYYEVYDVSAASAGSYAVVVTNRNGSATSAAATLTVNTGAAAAPVITAHPGSRTATTGSYLQFGVALLDATGVSYQWRKDGTAIAGATSSSHYIYSVTSSTAGRYSVVVTNTAGSATSYDAVVTVTAAATGPVFSTQPQNQSAYFGNTVTFTATATSTLPISYQWRKNGTAISGATTTTLTLTNVQSGDAATYSLLATDGYGSTPSTGATLALSGGIAPFIISPPVSYTAVAGSSVLLSASAGGTPAPALQWHRNGSPVPGATMTTLPLSNVQTADAGVYTLVARNDVGTAVSSGATLTVMYPPPLIVSQPQSVGLLVGETARFSVTAVGQPALSYQWRKDGVNLPGATNASLVLGNVQTSSAGRYSVQVRTDFGWVASVEALLTVGNPITAVPPTSTTVFVGGTATLTATVSSLDPLVFRWAKNGVYLPGATGTTLTINNAQPSDSGSYVLVVSRPDGTIVYPISGSAALFAAVSVVPRPAPVFVQQPGNATASVGTRVALSARAQGQGAIAYQWIKDGTSVPGATADTLVFPAVRTTDAGEYRVRATDANGTTLSGAARLTVTGSAAAGTYMGTFANGDGWALHVDASGAGSFIALLSGRGQIVVARNVAVSGNGEFTFGRAQVVAANGAADYLAKLYQGEVTGTIVQGMLTGRIDGAGLVFSGRRIETAAPLSVPAGVIEAVPLAAGLGQVAAVAGPDGSFLLVAADAAGVRGGAGRVDNNGGYTVTQADFQYRGVVSRGGLQGAYVPTTGAEISFATPAAEGGPERLVNVATRGVTGPGARILTAGFVVGGNGAKDVLVRAVGPGLAAFGVTGILPNPRLRLFRGETPLMDNDDWSLGGFSLQIADAAVRVGAFALPSGSADAAIVARLEPGAYTVQITGAGDTQGVTLVEVYDTSTGVSGGPKLVNLSTRGDVGVGGDILIVGVVVQGAAPKKLLIRGIGPALGAFGVSGALVNPRLQLYQGSTLVRENDDWNDSPDAAALATTAGAVGAFTLPAGSKDAALLLFLAPGSYTAQVSGVNGATGIALVETYEVP